MQISLDLTTVAAVATSYLLGGLCVGYYVVRWRLGQDIRELGSGNPGARNAGRLLGAWAFVVVSVGDAGKGALAVYSAQQFGLSEAGVLACAVAVVAGHIWPVQLRFRGGKGFATSGGAFLLYDWHLVAGIALVTAVLALMLRKLTPSAVLAMVFAPAVALAVGDGIEVVYAISVVAVMILVVYRDLIRTTFGFTQ
jgi:glycerol-3-phosphate acyltransferase PlsY